MATSRVKIKVGQMEVDYEGSEDFLKSELPQLLTVVAGLHEKAQLAVNDDRGGSPEQPQRRLNGGLQATTGSIAAKIQAKSGAELILAASARLTLVMQTPTFSRQRLLEEMKTASAYFRQSYVKNLSKYLLVLVKEGKLNEPTQGHFALSADSLKDLEHRIV